MKLHGQARGIFCITVNPDGLPVESRREAYFASAKSPRLRNPAPENPIHPLRRHVGVVFWGVDKIRRA